ncbi:hypothetical protein M0L20_29310 [Spirosoma sp. RP8]|uniref:Uncharacterized protein n=1 Tax=Spirosoma liriopis TaxID=2937440 RepID=A0ABT0HVK0_9BACT|nr:hypothetical protein [Spirosoma liriopis]
MFTNNFIGQSQNADLCRIVNPDVLMFNQSGQTLIVCAQQPLVIDNKALGYRLRFQLDYFRYSYDSLLVS